MSHYEEEDRRGRRGRYRSEADKWDDEDRMLFDHFNEENRRGRSARTGRYVHRADMEDDPRDFWPLAPYPFMPFGMFHPDAEHARMGFTGNGRSDNAPYNGPLSPLKDLPLVGGGQQTANQTRAAEGATANSGGAATLTK